MSVGSTTVALLSSGSVFSWCCTSETEPPVGVNVIPGCGLGAAGISFGSVARIPASVGVKNAKF